MKLNIAKNRFFKVQNFFTGQGSNLCSLILKGYFDFDEIRGTGIVYGANNHK